jgi:DNA mismatch repair protein MutS
MYVACAEFEYVPYKNILTRISGDDNISRGHSSFVVEMTELRTILSRATENSLVLGDEICHGTEQTSALAIVASGIISLSQKACSFMFATHLHRLSEMTEITSLSNVFMTHLKVVFDEKRDCLVYDRTLAAGSGPAIYGCEVMRYVIQEQPEFVQRAMDLRKKLLDIPDVVLETRKSSYNKRVIVDSCAVCGKRADDVHHIDMQCTADSDGNIERGNSKFHKHHAGNLVSLCKKCHINTHHWIDGTRIHIHGYKMTSAGKVLDYEIRND